MLLAALVCNILSEATNKLMNNELVPSTLIKHPCKACRMPVKLNYDLFLMFDHSHVVSLKSLHRVSVLMDKGKSVGNRFPEFLM